MDKSDSRGKINDLHKSNNESSESETDTITIEGLEAQMKARETDKGLEAGAKDFQEKYAELEDKYKRLLADQQNMINRFAREREEVHKYAAATTLEKILPALDNFDFAKKSLNENTSFEEIIKSLEMLRSQLMMCLKSVGLEEVDTKGQFNPEQHEAITKIQDSSKPNNTIVEVVKQGFKLKDRVLRVASVIVSSTDS